MKLTKLLLPGKRRFFQLVLGVISFLFMCLNVAFWTLLIHLIAFCLMIKTPFFENLIERCFNRIFEGWVTCNEWWFQHILGVNWQLDKSLKTDFQRWNLMIANHRSWVDVFVILAQLKGRRPLPRIFMKQQLLWLPLVGSAAYLMGFPFMKRYSKVQREKDPNIAKKDLETTRRSCAQLLKRPSSILSFAEGTRFSVEKQQQQASPYTCLLKPKGGGIGLLLQAMPQKFDTITDISILYGQQKVSAWDVLCGRLTSVKVIVREVSIPKQILASDYQAASKDRDDFFSWFNLYWQEKDMMMNNQLSLLKNDEAS